MTRAYGTAPALGDGGEGVAMPFRPALSGFARSRAVSALRVSIAIAGGPPMGDRPNKQSAKVNLDKRMKVWKRDRFRCAYCGAAVDVPHDAVPQHLWATVDHVVPRSRGGRNNISNLRTACRDCNSAKGSSPLAEFLAVANELRRINPGTALKRGWL